MSTPTVYGPLFTALSTLLAPLDIAASVMAYKAIAAISCARDRRGGVEDGSPARAQPSQGGGARGPQPGDRHLRGGRRAQRPAHARHPPHRRLRAPSAQAALERSADRHRLGGEAHRGAAAAVRSRRQRQQARGHARPRWPSSRARRSPSPSPASSASSSSAVGPCTSWVPCRRSRTRAACRVSPE